MVLSEEDTLILTLEKKVREIYRQYDPLPNCEARYKLHEKAQKLNRQINAMIFDSSGNFRKDKIHLLICNSLNIKLLDNRG